MSKILVVVDMQNDFVTGSLGTNEAKKVVPVVEEKIKKAKANKDKVFATMDTHFEIEDGFHKAYFDTQEGNYLPVLHCIYNTWGWDLVDEVQALVERTETWWKFSFGSLRAMEAVRKAIEENEVEEVEFCGLCTDICVIANVVILKTLCPEVKIIVDSKACAGVTPQKHEAALEVMRSLQVQVF